MSPDRRNEVARSERILPGVWRLRLPCPWPGVPHCNSWAVTRGDGVVLFDTGIGGEEGLHQLELALGQAKLKLRDVRLVVCTHSHADHYGAAAGIVDAAGCELWMHPAWGHVRAMAEDPDRALDNRIEVARQSGVPAATLERYEARRGESTYIDRAIPPDRELLDGVEVATDLGFFRAYETPGHAPSHVVLHEPESGLLVSGDHLLGRISLFYDHGHTPDPVGEFITSLDVVDELDIRLCLPGHGRTFRDVDAKIAAYRKEVESQLGTVRDALADGETTPYGVVEHMLGAENLGGPAAAWALQLSLAYLDHLEVLGEAERVDGADPVLWRTTG
ncbi:MAG: MBL fold metallo-hydrolase [Solirubrobacterales bacterium]|nr:MBL fold metallo-hydrolase [Solirubrobacterales bacterium]